MRLKKLIIKNIRSYEEQEIIFPEGSVLLAGDIGSGKTSLLLAIEYALFGLQPGQRGSALLRSNTVEGSVILELEIAGKELIIERKLRRGPKAVSNEFAAITINGERIETSITELKTKILSLLGYPPEFIKKNNLLYRYTVYTPQEQMKQIILEDAEVRRNVIRHVFGVEKYKRIRENLTVLLNYMKEESKVLQGEIKDLEQDRSTLDSTKAFIKVLEDKIREKALELEKNIEERKKIEAESTELEVKIKEKEKFEKEVEKTTILIGSKKENLQTISKEILDINNSLSEAKTVFNEQKYKDLIKSLKDIEEGIKSLNLTFIDLNGKINSLEHRKEDYSSKKDRIFKIEICPTCLQNVSENHKHNILNEVEKETRTILMTLVSLSREKEEISKKLDLARGERKRLEEERLNMEILRSKSSYIEKSIGKLKDLTKQKDNLDKDVTLLSKHLHNLKQEILNFSKFNTLFRLTQEKLKKAFLQERDSDISLAELKKELELTHKEVFNIEKRISQKETSKKKLSNLLEMSDWLNNQFLTLADFVERTLLMNIRTEFSKLFNTWFHILAGESFEIQLDENFTPLIMQNGLEMDYSFLSGGERTAVALAYRLALNQIINSMISQIKTRDIIILDEPTEGFSETQVDKMRDVLEELKIKQLIIVSHEQKIESFVDNVIKLKKSGDISYIESSVFSTPSSDMQSTLS